MSLTNILNTNYENGISNRNPVDLLGSMGQLDPTQYITHFDDFNALPSFVNNTGMYTAPATGGVIALASPGGAITLNCGAVAGNMALVQPQSRAFTIIPGSRVYWRQRVAFPDINNTRSLLGLSSVVTTDQAADGIFFRTNDLSTTFEFVVRAFAVTQAIVLDVADVQDNNFLTLAFMWDGIDHIYYGVNETILGSIDMTGLTLPAGVMGPTFGPISGVIGGTRAVSMDYTFTAQERG